jgi:Spy/CpxP family protein refolding chaperone
MNRIKTFALLLGIIAVFSSADLFSQQDFNKRTPEERAQKQSERMKKGLDLSDEQYQQVYDIFLKHITEADNIRNGTSVNEDGKEKLKALRESTHLQILAVLTPEQQVKFEEKIKEMKEKRKFKKNGEKLN